MDGPPQGARPRAEGEEEGQGGRRTPPRNEDAPLQHSDGSGAATTRASIRLFF